MRAAVELRALDDAALARRLDETRQELFNLRFRAATRQLTNTSEINRVRRRLARILTLMRERQPMAEIQS